MQKIKRKAFCFIKLNHAAVAIFLATDAQFLASFFYNGLAFFIDLHFTWVTQVQKTRRKTFCFIKLNRASVAIFLATDAQFLALF
jgi:hypothetical protein